MHVVVVTRVFLRMFMFVFMIVVVMLMPGIAMFMVMRVIVIMVVIMIMRVRVIMFLVRMRHRWRSFVEMGVLVGMTKFRRFDDELRRAKALLIHFVHMQPATGEAERIEAGLNLGERGAGVDQRAERHVAADAAGTIEIADFHRTWR